MQRMLIWPLSYDDAIILRPLAISSVILLVGWPFGFYPKIFFWLGNCMLEFRSHLKPLTLRIRNLRKSTFQLGIILFFCLSPPGLLSYLPFPFLNTPHSSFCLRHAMQGSLAKVNQDLQLAKSETVFSPQFLKTTQQHWQNWSLIFPWNTFLIWHPTLLGFLYFWYFFSSPSRPLHVGVLQDPILRPPFHFHSLSKETTESCGLSIISLVVSLTCTALVQHLCDLYFQLPTWHFHVEIYNNTSNLMRPKQNSWFPSISLTLHHIHKYCLSPSS